MAGRFERKKFSDCSLEDRFFDSLKEDYPEKIWDLTSIFSGISQEFFEEYYKHKDMAVAYKLGEVKKYKIPKTLKEFGVNCAPQSFVYI